MKPSTIAGICAIIICIIGSVGYGFGLTAIPGIYGSGRDDYAFPEEREWIMGVGFGFGTLLFIIGSVFIFISLECKDTK